MPVTLKALLCSARINALLECQTKLLALTNELQDEIETLKEEKRVEEESAAPAVRSRVEIKP